MRLIKEKPLGTFCGIIIVILLFVAIFADVLAPYSYKEMHLIDRLTGPSSQNSQDSQF
jgi:ABC-type antimicrobial peptide transport system permease subunit